MKGVLSLTVALALAVLGGAVLADTYHLAHVCGRSIYPPCNCAGACGCGSDCGHCGEDRHNCDAGCVIPECGPDTGCPR